MTTDEDSRILVVDDDPAVSSLLRRSFAYEGYRVDTAASGAEALRLARERPHTEVFILGAVFLLFLGTWSLMGRNLTLPVRPTAQPTGTGVLSVFGLGVFSGAASSCCAPVLIGVLTLTALTSSLPQATGVALAYVFGMVFPLLAAAYFWERFDLSRTFVFRGRPLELRALGVRYRIHSTNLIAGIIFWALGALILALMFTGQLTQATEAQISLFDDLRSATDFVLDQAGWLPGAVTSGAVVALFVLLLRSALSRRNVARHESRANRPTRERETTTLLSRRKERESDA